jgi:hypothetical protein
MTSFSTAVASPAAGIVTALATAVSDAQALSIALAPGTGGALTGAGAFLAGCTLNNLATNTSGWKMNAADMRVAVAELQDTLSVAGQQATVISNMLASIGTLD